MPSYHRRLWTDIETDALRALYMAHKGHGVDQQRFADSLGRTRASVSAKVKQLGLGESRRQVQPPRAILEEPCACGCGATVSYRRLAPAQIRASGDKRYLPGHQNRGKHPTPEHIAQTRHPMESNGRWKGGRVYDADGYVKIKQPEHPNAMKSGYVLEHRLVVEKRLGRYLRPDEVVHHINGIKNDNRDENLMVLSHVEHQHIERVGKKFPRPMTLRLICERCGEVFYRMPSYSKQGFTPPVLLVGVSVSKKSRCIPSRTLTIRTLRMNSG